MRVGTRSSKLALFQTNYVISLLKKIHPSLDWQVVPITTAGDAQRNVPIAAIGSRGVFVKELEEALLENRVDFVVHSLKDMPVTIPEGLALAAVPVREDPRDVIVSRHNTPLEELTEGSRIATSSRRRISQLMHIFPGFSYVDIRGNITTRLRKMDEGDCEAMVLAAAGLLRLELNDRIVKYLSVDESTPAAGQGALAVECRGDDNKTLSLLKELDDLKTRCEVSAEREYLGALGGGCSVPIGVLASLNDNGDELTVVGSIASPDGKSLHKDRLTAPFDGSISGACALGSKLASRMQTPEVLRILEEFKKEESRISAP